jgi:adenylate cyclase
MAPRPDRRAARSLLLEPDSTAHQPRDSLGSTVEFRRLMARFYAEAAAAVDSRNGIVDKFAGDELVALFIPGFAGEDHAADAIAAALELLQRTGNDDAEPWLPVGAGVHLGKAYIGTVGEEEALDFTALGDPVNTAARLAAVAGAGEILVSGVAAAEAGLNTAGLEMRSLDLRGRSEPLAAFVVGAAAQGAHMAPR